MNPTIDRLRLAHFGNIELLAKQVVEGLKGIPIIPAIGNHDTYP